MSLTGPQRAGALGAGLLGLSAVLLLGVGSQGDSEKRAAGQGSPSVGGALQDYSVEPGTLNRWTTGENIVDLEMEIQSRDGQAIPISVSTSVIEDEEGLSSTLEYNLQKGFERLLPLQPHISHAKQSRPNLRLALVWPVQLVFRLLEVEAQADLHGKIG